MLALGTIAVAPAQAAKAPKGFFGVAPQESLDATDYQLMQAGDVGSIRIVFNWPDIQGTTTPCTAAGGGCSWGALDAVVGNAAARGITVLPTLYGASPGGGDPRKPPINQIDLWKQFVRSAVERYGSGGLYWQGTFQGQFPGAATRVIKLWQVWNEPNSHQFFPPKGDPQKYAKLLKAAASSIKAADKKSKVMLGGMFGETGPKNLPIAKFVSQLYKVKGIERSFDIAAIHPYAANAKGLLKQIESLHDTIKRAKDNAKIWISEIGFASGGPNKPVVKKNENEQAKALTQAFKAFTAKRGKLDIAGVTWFSWEDSNLSGICKFCRKAGLVDVAGQPKPAYRAFSKAAK